MTTPDAHEAARVRRFAATSGLRVERVFDAMSLGPGAMAVAISVAMILLFIALGLLSGDLAEVNRRTEGLWSFREVRLGLLVAMQAGYLVGAFRWVLGSAARSRDALQPWVDTDASERDTFLRLDPRSVRRAALAGLVFVPVTALIVDRDPALYLRPDYWSFVVAFAWVVGLWVSAWLGAFAYATFAYARRFSGLADQLRPIDLLDLSCTAPLRGTVSRLRSCGCC